MYSERYSLRGRQAHGRRRARRRASAWKAPVPLKGTQKGKGLMYNGHITYMSMSMLYRLSMSLIHVLPGAGSGEGANNCITFALHITLTPRAFD